MATEVLWWIFAALIVALSAGVVFSRSVIHSAIFLIGSLAGVGAMYVFLTVEFLALVQFLIYGGAVTVLILLALMLTRPAPRAAPEKSRRARRRRSVCSSAAGSTAILIGVAVGNEVAGQHQQQVPRTSASTSSAKSSSWITARPSSSRPVSCW